MLRIIVAVFVLAAAGCSPPSDETAKTDMNGMSAAETEPAALGPISGSGVVTAIDAAAGTVSLDHGPIAAINWPAMSMQFTVESAAALEGIEVGEQVAFELKSASEPQVITMLREQ
jgi:Cu(I)/Ag(I) efflux system protein CusF